MVEAATDAQGALADGGVLKAGPKLAAGEAAHAAGVALRAEPDAARGGQDGQAQAARMVRSQTGPAAHHQTCVQRSLFQQFTQKRAPDDPYLFCCFLKGQMPRFTISTQLNPKGCPIKQQKQKLTMACCMRGLHGR